MRRQAEDMHLKSSATIYPEWDRTSPITYPTSFDVIKLNQIKSDKFSSAYQWIEWEFDVEEAGLYNITTRFKQTDRDGAFCNRSVYVNGVIPCEEAKYVHFDYKDGWQVSNFALPTEPPSFSTLPKVRTPSVLKLPSENLPICWLLSTTPFTVSTTATAAL